MQLSLLLAPLVLLVCVDAVPTGNRLKRSIGAERELTEDNPDVVTESEEVADQPAVVEAPKREHNLRDHIIYLHGLSNKFLPHNEDYAEHDRLLEAAIHALKDQGIVTDEVAHMHVHRYENDAAGGGREAVKEQSLRKFMEKEHLGPKLGAHRWAYQNLRGGKPATDDRPHPLNFTFNMTIDEFVVIENRKKFLQFVLILMSPLIVFQLLSWYATMSLWDFLKMLWDKFKDFFGLVCEEYVCEEEIIEEEEIIIKEPTPEPTPPPSPPTPVIPEPPPKKPPPTPKPKPPPPPPPPPKKPPPPLPPSTPSSYDTPPLDKCCPCIPTDSEESFDDTIKYPCGEDPCEFAIPVKYKDT